MAKLGADMIMALMAVSSLPVSPRAMVRLMRPEQASDVRERPSTSTSPQQSVASSISNTNSFSENIREGSLLY